MVLEAPMVMVETDALVVERDLAEGRIRCPDCGGVLVRWGWARSRVVRSRARSWSGADRVVLVAAVAESRMFCWVVTVWV